MKDVEEPEARAAFIWILGEHGQGIQVSPAEYLRLVLEANVTCTFV